MRGWWSARPKAKVWDTNPRALPTAREVPADTEPSPVPPPAPESSTVRALFEPRPSESAPAATTPPPPFPYAPPAVDSIRPAPVPKLTAVPQLDVRVETPAATLDSRAEFPQAEFFRLLEVVTSMCDHVIEYIEADRAERQQMMDTLAELGRVITEGAASAVAALAQRPAIDAGQPTGPGPAPASPRPHEPWAFAQPAHEPGAPVDWRERVIGGSVAAGPEPHLDLVRAETEPGKPSTTAEPSDIAVEVRGRFGDRWVDGFEICEVMTTPTGPRYRLRRQRDGVVLPELFDATNIRHVETFDQTIAPPSELERQRRERSMGLHPSGSEPGPDPVDGPPVNGPSDYWSRS